MGNVREVQRRFRELKKDINRAGARAANLAVREGKEFAKRRSSGPMTEAQRRAADWPYAKRHGPFGKLSAITAGNPGVINVGRGRFRGEWRTLDASATTVPIRASLINNSDVAAFLVEGTERAIARPIDVATEGVMQLEAERQARTAKRDIERKYS
ncbi:MAG: hypothetical protein IH945_09445 [Armatimonadetes bacterium]|nr:hypothetical protein [Armatimonadota bacterium]